MNWLLLAAGAATILSGFFSLNGYALRAVSRRDLEAALPGKRRPRADEVVRRQGDLQMLCALLRVVSNLTLLVVLLYLLEAQQQNILRITVAVALTAGILGVFGVAVPQTWARHAPARVLAVTAGALLVLRWALCPVVVALRGVVFLFSRLSGTAATETLPDGRGGDTAVQAAVKDEILQVASEAEAEGAVDNEEVEMIESVIEFGDQRAGEIMTPRTDIVALPLEAAPETVRKIIISGGHSRMPIYDGDIDNIVGTLHVKDLLAVDDFARLDLRKIVRKPFFVPETKPLDDLLREFKAGKYHMAIVLDEYGGTAGLVTIEDLLEEIVGDISDEYDPAASPLVRRLDERTVEADGRLRVAELNDLMDLHLPEDADYDTVAGMVFSELGFVPPVGETLTVAGVRFTVLAADARKITRLKVELQERPEAQP